MQRTWMVAGVLIIGSWGLAGCQQSATPATNTAAKTAKKATATDKLLRPLAMKVPSDTGVNNGPFTTESHFYQKSGHWYWRLTSGSRNVGGRVSHVKKVQNNQYDMRITSGQTVFALTLDWTGGTHYGYTLTSKHAKLNQQAYVLCDGQDTGDWHQGAPAKLKGTWQSPFYKFNSQAGYVYRQTEFTILDDSANGVNNDFKANKTDHLDGAGWGANDHLYYKKLGAGTYMLKSYSGQALNLNQVHLANGKLTIFYRSVGSHTTGDGAVEGMHRISDATAYAAGSSADETSSDTAETADSTAATDTNNLTTAQVQAWVWTDFKTTDGFNPKMTEHDYIFDQNMNDDGLLYIDVREDHTTANMQAAGAASDVAPRVGAYRINAAGHLQHQEMGGSSWDTVATKYDTD